MTDLVVLTKEQIEKAVPPNLRASVTDQLVDRVNKVISDPIIAEQVRDNFLSYSQILREGKFKMEDYLNAVVYVSHKLMNKSNQDAYFATFPDRHVALTAKGATAKDISAYVSAYSKNKLVNLIMEQSLIPSWVLNQDKYQAAINVQYQLMTDEDVSPKVRSDAANSLLTHLGKPKDAVPVISIDMRESSGMLELKSLLSNLAQGQREAIQQGVSPKEIAAQKIIDVDAE
jgi:hypothetical protein